jgi:hypothetical protein
MQPNRQPISDMPNIPQPELYARISQIEDDFAADAFDEASAYVEPEGEDDVDTVEAAGIVESLQRRAAW